ncbi:MAG: DNA methyltransferase [Clostridia bacterium]|nr:DNA methyltransferase [Clostridia bacterium]MDD4571753.1 DNA methyltransferase [Clostridia bacterium]
MQAKKASRNKTIVLEEKEKLYYSAMAIKPNAGIMNTDMIKNKLVQGDFFEAANYLPPAFVDLLIVDPPYNLNKNYGGEKFNKKSQNDYRSYTVAWLDKVLPLLKPKAQIYVCCDWQSGLIIGEVLQQYFYLQNRITWQREKGRGAKKNWKNAMEDIYFCTRTKDHYFNAEAVKQRRQVIAPYKINGEPKDWEETALGNFRNTYAANFWDDISIPYWSMPENTDHPTQKPEKLLAKLILASSQTGDFVFDPFMGSGTTAVVAKKLGRDFGGVELNPNYIAVAMRRLEMADADKSIQGYADGVFWERNTARLQNKYKK